MRVNVLDSHQLFNCNYLILKLIKKVFRKLSDTSTSNRRLSISTSREILILTQ
jgi:hypothetical protein